MAVTEAEPTTTETQAPEPAARTDARKMFRHSAFIDVGEGAEECPHARDGECTDIEHFHAWVRLPNPFQHEDIRKKGLAAKARKLRELRDPESDASLVLEYMLEPLRDEARREEIIDDLLLNEWAQDYFSAQADVDTREEFEHVRQDQEEFGRLRADEAEVAEEEHSDEYKRLAEHLETYAAAVRERLNEIQEPKRAEHRGRSLDDLIAAVREKRVAEIGDRAFLDTYDPWMWFVGTFKVKLHPTLGRPHLPMWEDIGRQDRAAAGTMFGEAPEVIDALKHIFDELNVALQRASAGN